jgi:MATE family multidrug resistance protein
MMQFVDRFMVSRLGTDELAAILPAGLAAFIPASFLLGVSTTVNTFVSQSLGKRKYSDCSNYCWQILYVGTIYSFLMLIVMWPSASVIFRAMGQPASVIPLEMTYLRIMLLSQFPIVFIWACSQFFMGVHKPVVVMYAAVLGQVINVLANYTLIFGHFGFPAMGLAGAGWGTFVGVMFGAVFRFAVFLSPSINRKFKSRSAISFDLGKLRSLIRIGFPAGFAFMVNMGFLGVILFGLVGRFGAASLAAAGAVFSCINLSATPVVGLATVLTAIVGKAIGQGRKQVAIKQTELCLRIGTIYMFAMGAAFFIFRKQIMGFWSDDPAVVNVGTEILICAAVFQVFDAAVITYGGALRGAGDTLWMAIVSAGGSVLILGAGGFLLTTFAPQLGAIGVWIAFTANIIMVGFASRWRFKSNNWQKIDIFEGPSVTPMGGPVID